MDNNPLYVRVKPIAGSSTGKPHEYGTIVIAIAIYSSSYSEVLKYYIYMFTCVILTIIILSQL